MKLITLQILKQSQCVLLEPVMKIEIVVPEEKSSIVLVELAKRRAQIDSVDQRKSIKVMSLWYGCLHSF